LLLKPIKLLSKDTLVVLSLELPVVKISITVSSLLDTELKMELTTSSLRTHGAHHGVLMDTSKLDKRATFAVSSPLPHTQPSDIIEYKHLKL